MESRLLNRKRELEATLRRCRDPGRRQQLQAQLAIINRDCGRMFTTDEISAGKLNYTAPAIESKQYLIPTPEIWAASANNVSEDDAKKSAEEQHRGNQERIKASRAEAEARLTLYNAAEKKNG